MLLFIIKLLSVLLGYMQIKTNYKNKYTLGPKTLLDMDIKFDDMYKVVHHSILLLSIGNQ